MNSARANSGRIECVVEGVGLCAPGLPTWNDAIDVLRGDRDYASAEWQRPAPALLSANERRRAPDSVLLALAVAEQACVMAGREPRLLPNVFASAYGDLAINDYLCAELARAPLDISPTKFHNSVHNAAAGYWTIATGCMAASSAVSAGAATVGAALLETALIVARDSTPALLVVFDTATQGPLADVIDSRSPFAMALVLAPAGMSSGARAGGARLGLRMVGNSVAGLASLPSSLHSLQATSPAAGSLPLLAALALAQPVSLAVEAGPPGANGLTLEISF